MEKPLTIPPEADQPEPNQNGLVVLVLRAPVQGTCARLAEMNDGIAEGAEIQIVGFGHNNRSETSGLGTQRKARVKVRGITNAEFVARGDTGEDTCVGDSGGPAYLDKPGGRILAGITSRSVTTGDCGHGGIYTGVGHYAAFLEQVKKAHG